MFFIFIGIIDTSLQFLTEKTCQRVFIFKVTLTRLYINS